LFEFGFLQNAVSFQTYALLSRALVDPSEQAQAQRQQPLSYERVALAGIGAGTIQTLILSPVDLIKIRLQLQTARRSVRGASSLGPLTLARNIFRKEGIRGLYRGWGITVLRDAPSHGGKTNFDSPTFFFGMKVCEAGGALSSFTSIAAERQINLVENHKQIDFWKTIHCLIMLSFLDLNHVVL
jgi:hypothetical protein